jgi:outer membrane usher protein
MLEGLGIDFAKIGANGQQGAAQPAADECVDLSAFVPGATVDFDFTEQKLALSVPQKYMRNAARGYVPPELWENGVNAGFLSYKANAYQSNSGGLHSTQEYLGLNAGVNIGGWHFRHQSSVTASTGQPTQFDNIATYVQHDVTKLRSQVTLGDAQTTGDVFDSVSFRGAQIATDDRMLPESLRGYAPVVRGTADSNARVSVRQNGQVIYETNVSPGPFEIRDLYATGYGGNLDVTVTEADGRTKSFTVPYASVAQSLRPGTTRFAVTAGQLRDSSLQTKPGFTQFTLQRGFTNLLTLYGGAIASNGYLAANVGAAFNTEAGRVRCRHHVGAHRGAGLCDAARPELAHRLQQVHRSDRHEHRGRRLLLFGCGLSQPRRRCPNARLCDPRRRHQHSRSRARPPATDCQPESEGPRFRVRHGVVAALLESPGARPVLSGGLFERL